MVKVRAAIYYTREVVGFRGLSLNKTTKEFLEGDLDDKGVEALKRLLKGGRKNNG